MMILMRKKVLVGVSMLLLLAASVLGIYFLNEKINRGIGFRIYRSARQGYEVRLPRSWVIETTEGAADVFWSPDDKAYVAVQFITDPRLLEEGGEEKMVKEIRGSFRNNPDYELFSFRSRFEEEPEPATVSGYLAQGKLDFQKERFVFQEYAVQIGNEEILVVVRGAMQEEVVGKYENTVEEIMTSFNPVAGRREAIALVKKQGEVVDFEELLAKIGKKANYEIMDDGDSWLIQVYEVVEQDGERHTATFNWYRVNKETKLTSKVSEADE